MYRLCTDCNKVVEGKHSLIGHINLSTKHMPYLAGLNFACVVIILITAEAFGSSILGVLFGIFFLLNGILNLNNYYTGGKICSICNKTNMLSLNSPKAQTIIKDNDIAIPEEAQKES